MSKTGKIIKKIEGVGVMIQNPFKIKTRSLKMEQKLLQLKYGILLVAVLTGFDLILIKCRTYKELIR